MQGCKRQLSEGQKEEGENTGVTSVHVPLGRAHSELPRAYCQAPRYSPTKTELSVKTKTISDDSHL